MCRLLGFVSREATTIPETLGTDFHEFTSLSRGIHADGWGVAAEHETERTLRLGVEAAHSSDTYRAASAAPVQAGIVHLRAATLGLPVSIQNTHPFIYDEWSFAHNGSIEAIAQLEEFIDEDLRAEVAGDTDSERYLLAVMSELRRRPVVDAVRAVTSRITGLAGEAAVNALLLGRDQLVVVSDDTAKSPAFLGPDYYELSYRVSDEYVAVASSGWARDGWHRMPPRSILTVDRATLAVEFHDLDAVTTNATTPLAA